MPDMEVKFSGLRSISSVSNVEPITNDHALSAYGADDPRDYPHHRGSRAEVVGS